MKILTIVVAAIVVLSACDNNTNDTQQSNSEDTSGLTLLNGFRASVIHEGVGASRHIAVRSNGDVFVKLRNLIDGSGLVALRDADKNEFYETVTYFGDFRGTEVKIHGDHLYATSDVGVFRYKFEGNELVPSGAKETVVTGFPSQDQHAAKPIAFDFEGNLYVHVGVPSNSCMEQTRTKGSPGLDPCPQLSMHGGVWKYPANTTSLDAYQDGQKYATGIRHFVGMAWNSQTRSLYGMQHGRDQLHSFFPDLYDTKASAELPSEEFLKIEEGDDFGWPYCYFDQIQDKKVLAPEYGGDGNIVDRCESKKDPILGFPGHFAPNDLLFYSGTSFPQRFWNGAFIAFHGSWNRAPEPQMGYLVAFVPFDNNGNPTGEWEVFATGFAGVEVFYSPADAQFRPCGLAVHPDGSLLVVDSKVGRIWKIMYAQ